MKKCTSSDERLTGYNDKMFLQKEAIHLVIEFVPTYNLLKLQSSCL